MDAIDAPARRMYLAELALDLARQVLKPGGNALIKVLQGAGFQELVALARRRFERVKCLKPEASRLAVLKRTCWPPAGGWCSVLVKSPFRALRPRSIDGEMKLNDLTKNILLWVVIVLVMLAVFSRYMPSGPQRQQLDLFRVLQRRQRRQGRQRGAAGRHHPRGPQGQDAVRDL